MLSKLYAPLIGSGVPLPKATKCFKINRVAMELPNLSKLKRMEVDALTDSADDTRRINMTVRAFTESMGD